MQPPEVRKVFRQYERKLLRDLQRDRPKLFRALAEFANIRTDALGWAQFRKRWPNFFPNSEYDKVGQDQTPSISSFPYWLNQVWIGADSEDYLPILLGIRSAPAPTDVGTLEETWAAALASIPARFYVDWDEGLFRYQGSCDFQRALYLLFLDSWRARVCEKCEAKFVAARAAQKFCSTDCSESMQREFRRRWWAQHGEAWRQKRRKSKSRRGGRKNGTRKAR
jgi:hypothetical protein